MAQAQFINVDDLESQDIFRQSERDLQTKLAQVREAERIKKLAQDFGIDPREVAQLPAGFLESAGAQKPAPQFLRKVTPEVAFFHPEVARQVGLERANAESLNVPVPGGRPGATLGDTLRLSGRLSEAKAPQDVASQILGQFAGGQIGETLRQSTLKRQGAAGSTISPALMKAIGTKDFDDVMAQEALGGNLDANKQAALVRIHDARRKARMPEAKVVSGLTDLEDSFERLSGLKEAYKQTSAFKTGKLSNALRLSITRSTTVAGFLQNDLLPLDKLKGSDVPFAAKFNTIVMGLRRMYDDQRLSDQDRDFALAALGSPIFGKELYIAQLEELEDFMKRKHRLTLQGLKGRGKDISELPQIGKGTGKPLNRETALQILREAGGDPKKAEQIARDRDFVVE